MTHPWMGGPPPDQREWGFPPRGVRFKYRGHGHHGHGRGHGPYGPGGPFGPFGPPPGPWAEWAKRAFFGGPPGPGWKWRGRRVGRGDVRSAALLLLDEQPLHGYQIIQEISQRSRGMWRPSPGSVYPMLQQLEDEGLVEAEQAEGRRVFHLTDAGRSYVAERRDELEAVWSSVTGDVSEDIQDLQATAGQVMGAMAHVLQSGTEAQLAAASRVLAETRRRLYQILAEDEPATDDPGAGDPGTREA